MRIGFLGFPYSGKKTLFELLTGARPDAASSKKDREGVAEIIDPRFDELVRMYRPRKEVRARINISLLPHFESAAIKSGEFFRNISDMDALCLVVRDFADDSIPHSNGSIDPLRDIDQIISELILHDLIFVERRLERIEQNRKKNPKDNSDKEKALMLRFKDLLDAQKSLGDIALSPEEWTMISGYPFITMKKLLVVLNVSEDRVNDQNMIARANTRFAAHSITVMNISAKLESEIAQLESAEEKAEFLREAGIVEPAINLMGRLCMQSLGLISFFTVGADEVKQWHIREKTLAPEAGGAIHTDIQRGFIRAEVMKYADLIQYTTEDEVKKAGKLYVMGKDYCVENGDIINFRFNV